MPCKLVFLFPHLHSYLAATILLIDPRIRAVPLCSSLPIHASPRYNSLFLLSLVKRDRFVWIESD